MRVPNRLVNFVPIQLRTIFSIIWPASIRTDLFQASPLDRILSPKESLRQRHREAYTDSSWSPCTMNISFNNTESNLYCPCTIQYIQKIVHRNSRSVVSIGKATLSSAVIASSSALLYAAKNIWLCQNFVNTPKPRVKKTDCTDILLCKLFSVLWYWWSQRPRDYTHLQSQHSIVPLHMTVGWKRLSRNCSAT